MPIDLSDQVLPIADIDDTHPTRTVLCWTSRFDDVLDANQLHAALVRLLEIGDWKKLGGRLRQNEHGRLEVHVPQAFTADRPSVRYSREDIGTLIDEHPLASRLPTATEQPSLYEGPPVFLSLGVRADAPRTIEEYLHSDESLLSLHVVTFTDATLVSLVWPQTLSDFMGIQSLVKAWSLVLKGRDDEVLPLKGVHQHPLATVGTDADGPHEPPLLPRLQGMSKLASILQYHWDLWRHPELQSRTIYLPARTIALLKDDAIHQLACSIHTGVPARVFDYRTEKNGTGDLPATQRPFLSDGDILTGWVARAAYRALIPSYRRRTLSILNLYDSRGSLPSAFDPNSAYLINATFPTFANVTASQAGNLAEIAAAVRANLVAQTTPAQVRTAVRELRMALAKQSSPFFWKADSLVVVMSNWARGHFFDTLDFRPAVIRDCSRHGSSEQDYRYGSGHPVFSHAQLLVPDKISRQNFQIMGRDATGGYWLFGALPTAAWISIAQELETSKDYRSCEMQSCDSSPG